MSRATAAARLAGDIVINIARQVIVEPIRTGRLRPDGWADGVRAMVGIALAVYLAGLAAAVSAPLLRTSLAHDNRAGFPDAVLPLIVVAVVIIVGLVITGSLHAVWPIRVIALLLQLVLIIHLGSWSVDGLWLLLLPMCWLPLLGFAIWRWTRPYAWWEYVVVQLLVAVPYVVAGLTGLRPALRGGFLDEWATSQLLIMTVTPFAFPVAMLAGLALSEVAFSTAVWFTETVSVRVPVAVTSILAVILIAVSAGSFVRDWLTSSVPTGNRIPLMIASAVVLAATLLGWRLIDRIADRGRAGSTQLYQLVPQTRTVGAVVSLLVMTPTAILMITNSGLRAGVPSYARVLGIDVPDLAPSGVLGNVAVLRGIGNLGAGVLAIGAALWLAVGRRRGIAELSIIIGLVSVERGLRVLGWLPIGFSARYVGAAAAVLTLVLAALWLIRGRLTPRRIEAVVAVLLLVLALTHREVLADPLAVLLGAGGSLLAFGLIWSLLTGAEDANGHSARFPRSARAILVTANLALVMIALAADRLARTSIVGLDAIVEEGASALGDPLIITGIWAVLSAAWRDEEVREAAWA